MLGAGGLVLNLHAQAADVHIHNLFLTHIAGAPHVPQNIPPGQGQARVLQKVFHNLELHLGQLNAPAVFAERAVPQIQAERPGAHLVPADGLVLLRGQGHPAVHRVHPGHQL